MKLARAGVGTIQHSVIPRAGGLTPTRKGIIREIVQKAEPLAQRGSPRVR